MCIHGVITSRCLYYNVNIEKSHADETIQHPVSMLTCQCLKNISCDSWQKLILCETVLWRDHIVIHCNFSKFKLHLKKKITTYDFYSYVFKLLYV